MQENVSTKINFAMKMLTILLFSVGAPEIILISLIVLLLFGAKKIPELMRSIGKGIKNFKEGVRETENEIKNETNEKKEETTK